MKAKNERIQRARLIGQMRQMIDRAKAEKDRPFTSSERETYNRLVAAHESLDAQIEAIENGAKNGGHNEAKIDEFAFGPVNVAALGTTREDVMRNLAIGVFNAPSATQMRRVRNNPRDLRRQPTEDDFDSEHSRAFSNYIRGGMDKLDDDERRVMRARWRANQAGILSVQNAQSTTSGTQGGYIIPQSFSYILDVATHWFGGIEEGYCTHFKTETGAPMPYPTVNDTTNMGTIIGQNVEVSEVDLVFGQLTFNAYIMSSNLVLVPLALIEDSAFPLDEKVAELLGIRLGRGMNHVGTLGSGAAMPTGIIPAVLASGAVYTMPTGSTASITYQALLNLQHSVDPSYRYKDTTAWMFSDSMLKLIKGLVDGSGRPLWQSGITSSFEEAAPALWEMSKPRILGSEFIVNNDMATPSAGATTMLYGDMSKFVIRHVGEPSLLRLVERFADKFMQWLADCVAPAFADSLVLV